MKNQEKLNRSKPKLISTGHLPDPNIVQSLVQTAYERFKLNTEGHQPDVYPALSSVPSDLFGLSIASVSGNLYTAGDAAYPFTIMSVSKPFVFALIAQAIGADKVRKKVGVDNTGLPFNSIQAIEQSKTRLTNPMVNPGAIAVTSLTPGASSEEKWQFIYQGLAAFAGHDLALNEEIYASASASNFRNRVIAHLLASYGKIYDDPMVALDLYTRQCSLNVTAKDLSIMAATLADGGVNPITKDKVVDWELCPEVLAVMATAGMYEISGTWLYDIGLPGKSGIGGGIITVAPGKGGLCTFAPLLDELGTSIKGMRATKFLSERLGLNIFLSEPNE